MRFNGILLVYLSIFSRNLCLHHGLLIYYLIVLGIFIIIGLISVVCIGAIHRYYESRRRLFNDDQPNRIEAARKTRLRSRSIAFRKQVRI